MTCLCSHNKMFVSDCCRAHDHLDLWNKPPLMVRGWNGGAGSDTANSETVTRGEVLQNQQPHDCDGFMFVFKPTNDRDQNVFLQPFTDVKIRSKSHPLTPEKGDVKEEARGKKRNFFFIFWPKLIRMQPVCVTDRQKGYLEPEVRGHHGVLLKMIPLWKLEKVKIFTVKRRISSFQRDRN